MSAREGSILILTLWVLSFLVVFALGLGRSVSAQLQFSAHLQDRLKMGYLAQAAIEKAVIVLEADQSPDYDTLNESWANSEELFKQVPLGQGYISVSYPAAEIIQQAQEQEAAESEQKKNIIYGIMDEQSKINVNYARVEILESLFRNIGQLDQEQAEEIAAAIVDWRDVDVIISASGAEDEYYRSLEQPYACKNSQFQVPEELLLVKGMTPEIYLKIADTITLWGNGLININTVDYPVLLALGLSTRLAEQIIEFRCGSDKMAGTDDDFIFTSYAQLAEIGPLFTEEAQEISRLISQNILTVKSGAFRITASGILNKSNRSVQNQIICVVQRNDQEPTQVLFWREN